MLSKPQRIILGDTLRTIDLFTTTFRIKNKELREVEQLELLDRIEDDIRTVLRLDKS